MKVGLNQPIMREVLEDSADDQQITRKLPVTRAKKGLKRLKRKTGRRAVNQKVVRSKSSTVVASLAGVAHSSESGQGDGAMLAGGEKENLIPLCYWQV